MIIFFAYFYTAIIFNPADVADNMRKYRGFVPGIAQGKRLLSILIVLCRVLLWSVPSIYRSSLFCQPILSSFSMYHFSLEAQV